MVLVTGNWKLWLVGMATSLVLFGVIYFAVIAPSQNTANQAITSSEKQAQQALNQAQQQVSGNTSTTSGAATSTQSSSTSGQGSSSVSQATTKAEKLASCLVSAGTDTSKIAACQAKY